MTAIRAFVGHSFTDDDAEVVGKFLKQFDRLSKLGIGFSWVHAEPAEPKELAIKVTSLIADKNVFIGICTKKERVITNNALRKSFYNSKKLTAYESQFEWKTSDWIVQEIGLAKGMNLELILLIEDEVREPGGLQGNIEYIPFNRASPEQSFGKILEMITALSPKISGTKEAFAETVSSASEESDGRADSSSSDIGVPRSDWEIGDYNYAIWDAILLDDPSQFTLINNAYLASEFAATPCGRFNWEARIELTRIEFGKDGSLDKLKSLAKAHANCSGVVARLADALVHYEEHLAAAKHYEAAARVAGDTRESELLLCRAAVSLAKAGSELPAWATIENIKRSAAASEGGELRLLNALRQLTELAKESHVTLAVMERIVELEPDDVATRFSLAYMHSECGNKDLALFHYLRIPATVRGSGAWNNLGVAFDQLSMPAKSVNAYQNAREKGESLAMSNLARKLITVGFLKEAREYCDQALAIANYNRNVPQTLSRLNEVVEQENQKESEIVAQGLRKSEFYRKFGAAVSQPDLSNIEEKWQGPDCILVVKQDGRKFTATGSYEQPSGILANTLAGLASPQLRYQVVYNGTIRGRAVEASVTRKQEGQITPLSTILLGADTEKKVLLILSDSGIEFSAMEGPDANQPQHYLIRTLQASV